MESLLGCDAEAEGFLESPALEITAEALAEGRTRSMVGRVLGPYQIVSFLGAGGMGEVYRARDSRIGRDVAIKVLPPGIAADPARLQRFEQEARATGALNHPNILAIHDIGFEDGAPYVVYELLDGETLRQRLRHGSLSRRKALDHARQIALGLAAAHEKSITHRDLKPENLFLTRDGRVKILDFGLAKLSSPDRSVPVHNISPSQTDAASTPGTPGYMAPEQIRAGTVDHRSDLFNLGAILYEMLTGRAPFRGRSTTEVLNAILKDDPIEAPETGGNFDPGLARLLRRCLEKNPNERIQSAQDLAFDLETLLLAPARALQPGRKKAVALLALAAVAFVLASFFAGRKLGSTQAHPTPTFHRLSYRSGVITGARFAPGGQSVIYSAAWDGKPVETFTMRIGGPESRPLGLLSAGVLAVSSAGELALSLGCELNWAECRGSWRVCLWPGALRVKSSMMFSTPIGRPMQRTSPWRGLRRGAFGWSIPSARFSTKQPVGSLTRVFRQEATGSRFWTTRLSARMTVPLLSWISAGTRQSFPMEELERSGLVPEGRRTLVLRRPYHTFAIPVRCDAFRQGASGSAGPRLDATARDLARMAVSCCSKPIPAAVSCASRLARQRNRTCPGSTGRLSLTSRPMAKSFSSTSGEKESREIPLCTSAIPVVAMRFVLAKGAH